MGRVSDALGETYVYNHRNERVLINKTDGSKELNVYGVDGLLYQVWRWDGTSWSNVASKERIYFAGRLVMLGGNKLVTDRLGSVVRHGGVNLAYYPYGQERTTSANDQPKFGTYTRDSHSGLDYAMNRYYFSNWGRFTTPDNGPPLATDPGTWNRYTYAWNDPINLNDPDGMLPAAPPGCVAYPFGAPGGSIDTSSNCPPGFINVEGWGGETWTSISPLQQVHLAVTMLEDIGAVVTPTVSGYKVTIDPDFFSFMADAGTIRITAGGAISIAGILIQIDVIAAAGGAVIGVLTSPVAITVVGVAALGGIAYYMAKNAAQNAQFKEALRRYERLCGKTLNRDEQQRVHRSISKKGYRLDEIVEEATAIFGCPKPGGV